MDQRKFDPMFAAALLYAASTDTSFYDKVGILLDEEMFTEDAHSVILKACKAVYEEVGHGPTSEAIVYQRLQRWVNEGKIKVDLLDKVADIYSEGILSDTPTESLIEESRSHVQSYYRNRGVIRLIEAHGRREDLAKECAEILRANSLAMSAVSSGSDIWEDSDEAMAELRGLERFPTGMNGLDFRLNGGFPRASVTLWAGSTGEGKSLALAHQAAVGMLRGLNVAYASIELPKPYIYARVLSALTGVPIDDFIDGKPGAMAAKEAIMPLIGGSLRVIYLEGNATTALDIMAFVDRVQQATGRPVDLLLIDPVDRLTIPSALGAAKAGHSSYSLAEVVMNSVRDEMALGMNLYVHMATQAVRGAGKSGLKDKDDIADSQHKPRIADNVVTLNVKTTPEGYKTNTLYVAKHRSGLSEFSVGPEVVSFTKSLVFPSDLLAVNHRHNSMEDSYCDW